MDDEKRAKLDADPVVDWSSSPDPEESPWEAIKVDDPEAGPVGDETASEIEGETTFDPSESPWQASTLTSEHEPEPAASQQKTTPEETATAAPGRSPLGILAFLALTGYLVWVALMCFENLGALHRQAESAGESEILGLQQDHAATSHMLVLHGLAAAPFLLATVLGVAGWRRTSQLFAMAGIAAVIYLLSWSLGEGQPYLNADDALLKTIMIAVAAWFA
jgi:hypothetical protein